MLLVLQPMLWGITTRADSACSIGPSYSTKAARSGVRICEVFDKEHFDSRLRELARGYKKRYGDILKYDVEEEISRFDVGCCFILAVETTDGITGISRKAGDIRHRPSAIHG